MFRLYTASQYQSSMSSNFLVFNTSGDISSRSAAFLFFIVLSTTSSFCCVNCHSLMSSWLLIFFVIVSFVTFGNFPSRFLKCWFHNCISSSWLSAFSLALAVLFIYCMPSDPRLPIFNQLSNLIGLVLDVFCLFFWVYVSSLCFLKFLSVGISWVPRMLYHAIIIYHFYIGFVILETTLKRGNKNKVN